MKTRTLARRTETTTVSVEPLDSLDGQGAPSYAASEDITAKIVKGAEMAVAADGSEVRVDLTLHVPGDESPLPVEGDRLTVGGATYIVVSYEDAEWLDGTLDHRKVMARDE